jgi:hypothetical protein
MATDGSKQDRLKGLNMLNIVLGIAASLLGIISGIVTIAATNSTKSPVNIPGLPEKLPDYFWILAPLTVGYSIAIINFLTRKFFPAVNFLLIFMMSPG